MSALGFVPFALDPMRVLKFGQILMIQLQTTLGVTVGTGVSEPPVGVAPVIAGSVATSVEKIVLFELCTLPIAIALVVPLVVTDAVSTCVWLPCPEAMAVLSVMFGKWTIVRTLLHSPMNAPSDVTV